MPCKLHILSVSLKSKDLKNYNYIIQRKAVNPHIRETPKLLAMHRNHLWTVALFIPFKFAGLIVHSVCNVVVPCHIAMLKYIKMHCRPFHPVISSCWNEFSHITYISASATHSHTVAVQANPLTGSSKHSGIFFVIVDHLCSHPYTCTNTHKHNESPGEWWQMVARWVGGTNYKDTVALINILLDGDREPNTMLISGKQLYLHRVPNWHSLSPGLK